MKIEIQDYDAPAHWRILQPIIERDTLLREDVTVFVCNEGCLFFDGAGMELGISLPEKFSGAALDDPDKQLALIIWFWWTFPRRSVAAPGKVAHACPQAKQ